MSYRLFNVSDYTSTQTEMNGLSQLQSDELKLFIALPYFAGNLIIGGLIAHAIMNHKSFGKHRVGSTVLAQALFPPQICISA